MHDTTVKAVQAKWTDRLPPLRLMSCWLLQTAVMTVLTVPVAVLMHFWRGPESLAATLVAAGVCWAGSILALGGIALFGRSGPNAPLLTLAFGMVFNCALPFSVGLVLSRTGGALAQSGVFGLIVLFFQFSLAAVTILTLCLLKSPR